MLVKQKGTFIKGLVMAVAFLIVLIIMFSPIFRRTKCHGSCRQTL